MKHLGIITDGNGRYAVRKGLKRTAGHKEGLKNIKRICKEVISLKIPTLSFYIFSTENFRRDKSEVDFLMNLIVQGIKKEISFFKQNNIKVYIKGNYKALSDKVISSLDYLIDETKDNDSLNLILCINYGGRDEIIRSVKRCLEKDLEINEDNISRHLDCSNLPFCDLIIRSGDRKRISNYLLWESAYSEIYFSEKMWPEFTKEDLFLALKQYNASKRTFGGL